MPRLSVWLVRCALLQLALGFTLGALLLANKGLAFAPWLWRLRGTHSETLLMGWALQLALGVAFWVLPRHAQGLPRGNERWGWLGLGLLNAGVLCAAWGPAWAWPSALFLGRLLEVGAALAFVWLAWPRVKAFAR